MDTANRARPEELRQIAENIRQQAGLLFLMRSGATRMMALDDARLYAGGEGSTEQRLGGLQFDVNGLKVGRARVLVELQGDDTYAVSVVRLVRGGLGGYRMLDQSRGVYCDDLARTLSLMVEGYER